MLWVVELIYQCGAKKEHWKLQDVSGTQAPYSDTVVNEFFGAKRLDIMTNSMSLQKTVLSLFN